MIPVADATGRDLSPSGLAGFVGLIEHTGPRHRRSEGNNRIASGIAVN